MTRSTSTAYDGNGSARQEQPDDAAEACLRGQDPVKLAAIEWYERSEEGLDSQQQGLLREWLAADPAHRQAFERLEAGLASLRGLSVDEAAHFRGMLEQGPSIDRVQVAQAAPSSPAPRRRWFMLGFGPAIALCGVVVVSGWFWLNWQQPTFTQSYATATGQSLSVELPDGSRLQFDTATRAEVRLYRNRREVDMPQGQAMFEVASDASKPFQVLAGVARVEVKGTRFSVRHLEHGADAGAVRVAVESGRVEVTATAPQARTAVAELSAGQAVQVSAAGQLGALAAIAPHSIAPWRGGLVSFENVPLADALAELERYGPTGLYIRDAKVAALRIGGSYRIGQPGQFASALPRIVPVKLVRRGHRTEIASLP